jgi:hypothetical protein
MALSKQLDYEPSGGNSNMYWRIEEVRITDKTNLLIVIRARRTADTDYHLDERVFEAAYDINGANPLAQAYAYVKALPEFASATDC